MLFSIFKLLSNMQITLLAVVVKAQEEQKRPPSKPKPVYVSDKAAAKRAATAAAFRLRSARSELEAARAAAEEVEEREVRAAISRAAQELSYLQKDAIARAWKKVSKLQAKAASDVDLVLNYERDTGDTSLHYLLPPRDELQSRSQQNHLISPSGRHGIPYNDRGAHEDYLSRLAPHAFETHTRKEWEAEGGPFPSQTPCSSEHFKVLLDTQAEQIQRLLGNCLTFPKHELKTLLLTQADEIHKFFEEHRLHQHLESSKYDARSKHEAKFSSLTRTHELFREFKVLMDTQVEEVREFVLNCCMTEPHHQVTPNSKHHKEKDVDEVLKFLDNPRVPTHALSPRQRPSDEFSILLDAQVEEIQGILESNQIPLSNELKDLLDTQAEDIQEFFRNHRARIDGGHYVHGPGRKLIDDFKVLLSMQVEEIHKFSGNHDSPRPDTVSTTLSNLKGQQEDRRSDSGARGSAQPRRPAQHVGSWFSPMQNDQGQSDKLTGGYYPQSPNARLSEAFESMRLSPGMNPSPASSDMLSVQGSQDIITPAAIMIMLSACNGFTFAMFCLSHRSLNPTYHLKLESKVGEELLLEALA
eukprot:gnl/MRDRNA2_/MRDRNA2_75861_c0_seq1.p1 gnl/MRDRNA2_/MRDRNA2_75861_c0~~gnl/MRDRNA2_/MRDRNA2_75861_c0_seq1.p1  ORF type:complete len:584 (+),score=100.96 gnl/MRDRNA2_/MRDRNA2_75861_c0_seq1:173-1924(+)